MKSFKTSDVQTVSQIYTASTPYTDLYLLLVVCVCVHPHISIFIKHRQEIEYIRVHNV